MNFLVKRLYETSKLPTRAHATDAGIDFYIQRFPFPMMREIKTYRLFPNERILLPLGVSVEFKRERGDSSKQWYLQLADKSGVADRLGLKVLAGVIDESYRGEIQALIVNTSNAPVDIHLDQKIVQGIIHRIECPEIVEEFELTETERGSNGFGSSGT